MSVGVEKLTPLLPATRALIGSDVSRKHDAAILRQGFDERLKQVEAVLDWMDRNGVPREQLTLEWVEAVSARVPELQPKSTKRGSNREQNWGRLLADATYLKRRGFKGNELWSHLRTMPPFDARWRSQDAKTLEIRLSEARNKSAIGKLLKSAATISPEAVTAVEDIWIAAEGAATLQSAVTGPL